ncbi:hypothetical protein JX265_000644 [Neoarthrinium moseri]|uniref:Uncharacterized protein n=1 Tax=Neoarthrinium moseri TaxID=1658444 RepID=A0A9Q0ASF3_9PEZI|nr:uncharacterized protein JN550_001605 [Neoarthrinium moseri]KAI1854238.1 hypothetical protein JX266_001379 [Neoarthrinium moseri]KAI1876109.1 hypothetical protein JN550_001605 [Neoarthrinium moseri]KAI1881818.1 hypothetical protein JX265_000644 [Neoarthrinium moseri]
MKITWTLAVLSRCASLALAAPTELVAASDEVSALEDMPALRLCHQTNFNGVCETFTIHDKQCSEFPNGFEAGVKSARAFHASHKPVKCTFFTQSNCLGDYWDMPGQETRNFPKQYQNATQAIRCVVGEPGLGPSQILVD